MNILLLLLAFPLGGAVDPQFLMSNLGTKTPYDQISLDFSPKRIKPHDDSKCPSTPSHIEVLARHGARHTGKPSSLTDLASDLVTLGSPLDWLEDYKYKGGEVDANQLLPLGVNEHMGIGGRVKGSLESSFFTDYNPNLMRFNSTYVARAGQSATSFLQGATVQSPFITMVPVEEDHMMR